MSQIQATWKFGETPAGQPCKHAVYRGKRIQMTWEDGQYVARVHGKVRVRSHSKGGLYEGLHQYFTRAGVIRG